MTLKSFVKQCAPSWTKPVLARAYRAYRGLVSDMGGRLARQDAMLGIMEQRMAEIERLCFAKVSEFEVKMNEVIVPQLLSRQDDSVELLHRELSALHAELGARIAETNGRLGVMGSSLDAGSTTTASASPRPLVR